MFEASNGHRLYTKINYDDSGLNLSMIREGGASIAARDVAQVGKAV